MKRQSCTRCGNKSLLTCFISLRCPLCGEYIQVPGANDRLLWSEHKHGMLFKSDGWRWLSVIEPPEWFLENVT
jgi:hypothetical protein